MSDCIFCKIIAKEIPAKIIYEDDDILAFHDINPCAEVHFLIIPKLHIENMLQLTDAHQALMGKMLIIANKLAVQQGLANGYKTLLNTGVNGGQLVYHMHIHIIGNKEDKLSWAV